MLVPLTLPGQDARAFFGCRPLSDNPIVPDNGGHMSRVELYTKGWCCYCQMAKALLEQDGVPYREYDIIADTRRQQEMFERSGSRTVPQIFIDGGPIGGFMELAELHVNGDLAHLAETGAKTVS